jgi:hypothetical protein
MTTRAILRFTPVYDPAMLHDPKLARALMVQRGALETIGHDQRIPVVVDHNEANMVGRVRELFIAPDVAGGVTQDWYMASCELDSPPGWLKRNGGVSWSYKTLRAQDVRGSTRLLRALISELSILTPATEPAEPRARVVWVGKADSSAAGRPTSERFAAGEVILHDPGVRVIRHNTGRILGVR